jgi:hypothetical protein
MLWESRVVHTGSKGSPSARKPAWATTVTRTDTGQGPQVIIGNNWGKPLLLDVDSRTVTELSNWPAKCSITREGEWFYIGSGSANQQGQTSLVSRSKRLEDPPEHLIDFGKREFWGNAFGPGPYFSSLLVVDHKLHLLANRDYQGRTPAWTVVDLRTGRASVLMHEFDKKTWPRNWRVHKLVASKRLGLLLISGGTAYKVQLPQESQWTRFEDWTREMSLSLRQPRTVQSAVVASRPSP